MVIFFVNFANLEFGKVRHLHRNFEKCKNSLFVPSTVLHAAENLDPDTVMGQIVELYNQLVTIKKI